MRRWGSLYRYRSSARLPVWLQPACDRQDDVRRICGSAVHHDDRRACLRDPLERIGVRTGNRNAQVVTGSYDDRQRHQLASDLCDLGRVEWAGILALERVIRPQDAVWRLLGRDLSMNRAELSLRQVPHVAIGRNV